MDGSPHLVMLPGTDWALWRWMGLRGAGFPAELVLQLAIPACARAADALIDAEAHAAHMRLLALAAVNTELDALRADAGWEDETRRKPLIRLLSGLKQGRLPRGMIPPSVAEPLAALREAYAQTETASAHYAQAFEAATHTITQALAALAADDRFREALLWQNRRAFHTGVATLRAAAPGTPRSAHQRQHEELAASYLQRYCVKNDTIGFFGPVGWARWMPRGPAIDVRPGSSLLCARAVSFEQWAIDALAEVLAKNRWLRPWLAPRRLPFIDLRDTTLYWPGKRPMQVTPGHAAVLEACTGERTAQAIAASVCREYPAELPGEAEVYKLLYQLQALGVITWTLEVPFTTHPERELRQLLERIGAEQLRRPALAALDELEGARDAVAGAAGRPTELDQALGALEQTFTRLTDTAATRGAGATYAARTLVYEDCRRDVEVELGPALLEELGRPLELVLIGARWLTYQAALAYRPLFEQVYAELARQSGAAEVELMAYRQQLQLRLQVGQSRPAHDLQRRFQERWAEILGIAPGQRQAVYSSAELRPLVAAAFAAPGPGWPGARYHSPDVMIAAASPQAIREGHYQFVMGELHMAANTLRGSLFVLQHPTPDELFAAYDHDIPEACVVPITPRDWPEVSARTRVVLVNDHDIRVAFTYDAGTARPVALPIGALVVAEVGGRPVVRTRDGRQQFDLIEFLTEIMTIEVVDSFKIFGGQEHTPRLTIDRLVVCREAWHLEPAALPFAGIKEEAARFVAARRWARELGLPRWVFVKAPVERKPFFVDFESPVLVGLLAKAARRTQERGAAGARITLSEMLPSLDQAWLHDAQGQRYTSELRIVAVDSAAPHGAKR